MAFNQQKAKKIATLCMIITCLDDEGEGIRKKGPDRDWLRSRAERGSYTTIITERASLEPSQPCFHRG